MTWGRVNDDRFLILGELSSLSILDTREGLNKEVGWWSRGQTKARFPVAVELPEEVFIGNLVSSYRGELVREAEIISAEIRCSGVWGYTHTHTHTHTPHTHTHTHTHTPTHTHTHTHTPTPTPTLWKDAEKVSVHVEFPQIFELASVAWKSCDFITAYILMGKG